MKKQLLAIPVLMLFMASVLAFDIDATRWSVRGDVALADVDNYFGQTLTSVGSAQSSVNAYINLQRGISGSGYIVVQGKNSLDENVRLSVNWNSRGNNYGFTSVEDTPINTIIYANARVIRNGQTTYGVPIVIRYFKNTGEFVVQGSNFRLSPIVTNLS